MKLLDWETAICFKSHFYSSLHPELIKSIGKQCENRVALLGSRSGRIEEAHSRALRYAIPLLPRFMGYVTTNNNHSIFQSIESKSVLNWVEPSCCILPYPLLFDCVVDLVFFDGWWWITITITITIGHHIHRGYWITGDESKELAQLQLILELAKRSGLDKREQAVPKILDGMYVHHS